MRHPLRRQRSIPEQWSGQVTGDGSQSQKLRWLGSSDRPGAAGRHACTRWKRRKPVQRRWRMPGASTWPLVPIGRTSGEEEIFDRPQQRPDTHTSNLDKVPTMAMLFPMVAM